MKTRITKIILSSVLSVGIIAGTVFALNTVNTGDAVTASSWNEIVSSITSNINNIATNASNIANNTNSITTNTNKLTSLNTNSSDLVTKSYVDSAVSAAGGGAYPGSIDWNDCEYKSYYRTYYNTYTFSCSTGYELVDHSCSVNSGLCFLNGKNSLYIRGGGGSGQTYGSIKCCKVNQ